MKPNLENIRKLVDAARSGEYEQVKGCLRRGDAFCIWGLACEISGLGEWKMYEPRDPDRYFRTETDWGEYEPPWEVEEWLGLEFDTNLYAGETLSEMNDRGVPFSRLADVLEKDYLTTGTCSL